MRTLALVLAAVAALSTVVGAERLPVEPFEIARDVMPANGIDDHVQAGLKVRGLRPAPPCSDAVFVRRVYLDVIGTLPTPAEVTGFLADRRDDKRARLIDALMDREEFADYWALKWCDVLRVKAEFPINLWPNAAQAYHRWVRDSLVRNKPYDRFARELLTSSGSNFRTPAVNFYRAIQGREPPAIARAAALTFMGTRIDRWPAERRAGLEAFFSRVAYKKTAEWKEEIVLADPGATSPLTASFPDGTRVTVRSGQDPRVVFADWLIRPQNKWFARNAANRAWAWLMGRGLIHEPDDIRPDNPAVHPEVLAYLERELVKSGYDMRHVFRLILHSGTYQQSSIPYRQHKDAAALFACYPVRRLDAEVLVDALCQVFGSRERYTSAIPEPFTFIPEQHRTIMLADGSISSAFLEMFGRPARDTGLWSERDNRPTDAQRLHLLNSSHIQKKIEKSWQLRQVFRQRGKKRSPIPAIYLRVLSRYPTKAEMSVVETYAQSKEGSKRNAALDLAWALVNTKEFLYRH